jgi:hypothetical protein
VERRSRRHSATCARFARRQALLAGILIASVCCKRLDAAHELGPAVLHAVADLSPTAAASPGATAALRADPPIAPLPVEGFSDAVISAPLGATSPRPVIVAAHGLWDPPEGLCDDWRWTVGDRAWVLCPRGRPVAGGTFKYESAPELAREIDAGLAALRHRYAGYVDDGPVLYAGFSLGAILGVKVVAGAPDRYPRAVLIEGGEDRVDPGVAADYARGGVRRVLFACGLKARVAPAQRAADALEHAGVSARVVFGKPPDAGQFMHWYNGPVAEEIRAQLDWLLEGDPRWGPSP